MTDYKQRLDELVKNLRIKSDCINMNERIAWGSETALMDEAAEAIEHLLGIIKQQHEALKFYASCEIAGKISRYNDDGSIAARARLIQDNGKHARDAITLSTPYVELMKE